MKGNDENRWSISNVSKGTRYTKRMYMLSKVSYALNGRRIMDICMVHGRSMKRIMPRSHIQIRFSKCSLYGGGYFHFILTLMVQLQIYIDDCAFLVMIQHISSKAALQRKAYHDINTHCCIEFFFEVKKGLRVYIGLYGMKQLITEILLLM